MVAAKPWTHYIPVNMNLTDFSEKMEWAKNNDGQVEEIAANGQELAENELTISTYRCYMYQLLKKYHSLLVSEEQYK